MTLKRPALTLQQAVEEAPTLAQLSQQANQSLMRLRTIQTVLPPALRTVVRAGSLDKSGWCLMVPHNAAAAKLRQLLPLLITRLDAAQQPVASIRIKVSRDT